MKQIWLAEVVHTGKMSIDDICIVIESSVETEKSMITYSLDRIKAFEAAQVELARRIKYEPSFKVKMKRNGISAEELVISDVQFVEFWY